jgi:hypothetical protein
LRAWVEDQQVGLAGRRAQATADLLPEQAQRLGGAHEDDGDDGRHVHAFGYQAAGAQDLHGAGTEAGNGGVTHGGIEGARSEAAGGRRYGHDQGRDAPKNPSTRKAGLTKEPFRELK